MLRLRTFGGLSIEGGPGGGLPPGRRPLAVLAMLAVSGERGLSRDKIIALLWPDSDEERGRNSLSQALSALRRDLASEELVTGTAELRLNPAALTSDVDEFERCIAASDLEGAATLYQGVFLDGIFLKGASEFERWVEEQRSRLHHLQAIVLERLARQASETGDRPAAVKWWRRVATLDPASARGAMGYMEALASAGDRAAALQHHRVYTALVRQEFGVDPDQAIVQLAARLRSESAAPVTPRLSSPDETTFAVESGARSPAPPAEDGHHGAVRPADEPAPSSSSGNLQQGAGSQRTIWWPGLIAAALFGVVLIATRDAERPRLDAGRVVVTGFVNRTGDSTLDAFGLLAADFIADGLQRSGLVEVTDPATTLLAVTQVRDSGHSPDDTQAMRLVAEMTHAGLVVSGHYAREGDSLVMIARVTDAARGTMIATTEPERAPLHAPNDALQRVSQRVMGLLAVRLDHRLANVLPSGWISPPTLPAYREYVDGLLHFQRRAYSEALPRFQQAYALDSTFVAPLVWQIFVFGNIGKNPERRAAIQALARHRGELTPSDRYALAYFEARERRDRAAQVAALQEASRLAPGSIWSYNLGVSLYDIGRFTEAVAEFEQIDRRQGWIRDWPQFWNVFVGALHYVDHRRELTIAREGRRALPTEHGMVYNEARALAALGQMSDFDRVVAELETRSDPRGTIGVQLEFLSMEFHNRGDTATERRLLDRSIDRFRALTPEEMKRAEHRRGFAVSLYHAGRCKEVQSLSELLLAENASNWQALMWLGLCAAREGRPSAAEDVTRRLLAASDADVTNLLRVARIAAVLGDPARAVRYLKELKDRNSSELWRHWGQTDFDGLEGYAPYMAITRPLK